VSDDFNYFAFAANNARRQAAACQRSLDNRSDDEEVEEMQRSLDESDAGEVVTEGY
jgi:hypothetical protein